MLRPSRSVTDGCLRIPAPEGTELVEALRQCDGTRVQAVVIVRDDFWMSVTSFLRELDVHLADGQNSAGVDRFDTRHARKVLAAFGRAFGALPPRADRAHEGATGVREPGRRRPGARGDGEPGPAQPVRRDGEGPGLDPGDAARVGGARSRGRVPRGDIRRPGGAPEHRLHQRAAREVLRLLLRDQGPEIRGHMRPYRELLEASGYGGQPEDFEDLMRILDTELRLITPTDPSGDQAEQRATEVEPHYQLTHDYLVPSLREWLAAKQKESRRGRAELRLAERAQLWDNRRETRQLPSLGGMVGDHRVYPAGACGASANAP